MPVQNLPVFAMKVYVNKVRKFSNLEIHEVFNNLNLLAEQG